MNKTVKALLLVGASVAGIILVKKVVEKRTAEAEKTEKEIDDQEVSEKLTKEKVLEKANDIGMKVNNFVIDNPDVISLAGYAIQVIGVAGTILGLVGEIKEIKSKNELNSKLDRIEKKIDLTMNEVLITEVDTYTASKILYEMAGMGTKQKLMAKTREVKA